MFSPTTCYCLGDDALFPPASVTSRNRLLHNRDGAFPPYLYFSSPPFMDRLLAPPKPIQPLLKHSPFAKVTSHQRLIPNRDGAFPPNPYFGSPPFMCPQRLAPPKPIQALLKSPTGGRHQNYSTETMMPNRGGVFPTDPYFGLLLFMGLLPLAPANPIQSLLKTPPADVNGTIPQCGFHYKTQ